MALLVADRLERSPAVLVEEVDFIQDDDLAVLHRVSQRTRPERRLAVSREVEPPEELVRRHSGMADHNRGVRVLGDRLSRLAGSGFAVVDLEAFVDLAISCAPDFLCEELEFLGLHLGSEVLGERVIRQVEVAGDVVPDVVRRGAVRQAVDHANLRRELELGEEFDELLDESRLVFHDPLAGWCGLIRRIGGSGRGSGCGSRVVVDQAGGAGDRGNLVLVFLLDVEEPLRILRGIAEVRLGAEALPPVPELVVDGGVRDLDEGGGAPHVGHDRAVVAEDDVRGGADVELLDWQLHECVLLSACCV